MAFGAPDSGELPQGWHWVKLREVCEVNPKTSFDHVPPTAQLSFVPMACVEELTGRMDTTQMRPVGEAKSGYTRFASGDVLFAKITPCMENGKIAVVPPLAFGVAFGSSEYHVLRPGERIDVDYLFYFLVQSAYRVEARRHMSGAVGQQRVPTDFLRETMIPLPPLSIQRKLVKQIADLVGEIEAGEQALAEASADLARYRRSVLKAAVAGELTADWRKSNPPTETGADLLARILNERRARWEETELAKMRVKGQKPKSDAWRSRYKEKVARDSEFYPALPIGWNWVRVGDIGTVQLGRQRSPDHHAGSHMRPYLRVANVFEDRIDLTDVMEMNFEPKDFEAYRLAYGDILLNEGQSLELVGRPAMIRTEMSDVCFTNTLVRFRPTEDLLGEFALIVFRHWMKDKTFQKIAKITTNIAHLGAGRFADLMMPIPPLNEQAEIVSTFQEASPALEELNVALEGGKREANRLRQSVLSAAFSGRLTARTLQELRNVA